jgi:hypothetical protein
MKKTRIGAAIGAALAAVALALTSTIPATAYTPTGGIVYQLPSDQACLKGRGNCAIYPKSAQLSDGRLVATFEQSTVVPTTGTADGQTLPVYKSDDNGDSWQLLSQVKAPAYASSDAKYKPYVSNWTNPYLYALPQALGNLTAGTLMLASVVSGDDAYYKEQKAANSSWTPTNDGDRSNVAIALYDSTDDGVTWSIVNVIATGGWQGGSAGAIGVNVATANAYKEVDPVWEPYLMMYDGKLICYYSDENDYLSYDTTTGAGLLDPANANATDSKGQVLAHRVWNGSATSSWSSPTIDVPGLTVDRGNGKTEIGGGRPGMANVVPTSDGKWMMTFEYWGGGANVRYKIADNPLDFFVDGLAAGTPISNLPVTAGSGALAQGGSPVLIRLPNGALAYNAAASASVWVNPSGSSTGAWTQYQTTAPKAYSRDLQYVQGTGRLSILFNEGVSTIGYTEVDLGNSVGSYYRLVNKRTGQVLGTGGNTTDANIGNGNVPDVRTENAGSVANAATEYWHLISEPNGGVALLNKSGGRAADIWTGNAIQGQGVGQWVDNGATGDWTSIADGTGYYKLRATRNSALYLTGTSANSSVSLQPATTDGSQDWQLVLG